MRAKLVAGNWKMHGCLPDNAKLLAEVIDGSKALSRAQQAVCVPFPYLEQARGILRGTRIAWGAQNLSQHAKGAYTGEVSGAMLRDFELLGIRSVAQLARQDPKKLYDKLCRITRQHQDICCLDVFSAAVAQARDPLLPAHVERRQDMGHVRRRSLVHGFASSGKRTASPPLTRSPSVGNGATKRALL